MTDRAGVRDARRIARSAAFAGAVIVVATTLVGGGLQPGVLGFAAWALLPYGVLLLAPHVVRDAFTMGGAASAVLAAELGVRASVFVFPRSSTAALALIFSPAVLAALVLPAGAAAGWVVGRAWRSGSAAKRVLAVASAALALAALAVGFVRPDWMPGPLLRRRAALSRIGAPRVVAGGDAFRTVAVSEAEAWFQTGDFDAAPGEEIAVAGARGATFLDPVDFHERGRIAFGGDPGRLWSWPSRLARLDGRLVVVQTGGGYSETEVRELDGRLLWRHRPDPDLPPAALLPADLDGDGRTELYAADTDSIARLDERGQEVWRRPARYGAQLLLSRTRAGGSPGWVAAFEPRRRITIWNAAGDGVGTLALPSDAVTARIVDWPDRRVLLVGETTLRGVDTTGVGDFELPLGDFTFTDALVVRLAPDAAPLLAVAAIAPRDVRRWRLLLLGADRAIAYDQVFDRPIALLAARRDDGAETLLVAGAGLVAIGR